VVEQHDGGEVALSAGPDVANRDGVSNESLRVQRYSKTRIPVNNT
jgi:hypothetical protein